MGSTEYFTWHEMCAKARHHPWVYLYGNSREPSPANFFETALHGLLDIEEDAQLSYITFMSSPAHNSIEASGPGQFTWTRKDPVTAEDFTDYAYSDGKVGVLWWAKFLIWQSEYAILNVHQRAMVHRIVFSDANVLYEQHVPATRLSDLEERIAVTFQPLPEHRKYPATQKRLSNMVSKFRRLFSQPLEGRNSTQWYVPKAVGMRFTSWSNGDSALVSIHW